MQRQSFSGCSFRVHGRAGFGFLRLPQRRDKVILQPQHHPWPLQPRSSPSSSPSSSSSHTPPSLYRLTGLASGLCRSFQRTVDCHLRVSSQPSFSPTHVHFGLCGMASLFEAHSPKMNRGGKFITVSVCLKVEADESGLCDGNPDP